jgi:dihydrofolate synthase/folylpolyglutamate synthase
LTARRTLAEWLAFQERLHPQAVDLGLQRVGAVARRLDLLPLTSRSLIVGGTNGKGSTATTAAALLRAQGECVGLFTSPHLVHYRERIHIDGRMPDDAQLVTAFERIEAARGGELLTFFEYNALAALELCRASQVSVTVLEVGLGGRLDATNIVDADVAVLCSVGLDHQAWLGESLEAIGAEKAGIFRAGRPVILGDRELPRSVYQRASELQCELHVAGEQFTWQVLPDGRWHYRDRDGALEFLPAPALAGAIQYRNAATALAAVRALPGLRSAAAAEVARGLAAVELPGRLQCIPGPVEWLLDVAHNEPAAAVLAAALRERPPARRQIAVCGMLSDKDVAAVTRQLDPLIDYWLLCGVPEARGLESRELQARCGGLRGQVELANSVAEGCSRARALAQAGDRVVVFGSFHTVGPALQWLGLY